MLIWCNTILYSTATTPRQSTCPTDRDVSNLGKSKTMLFDEISEMIQLHGICPDQIRSWYDLYTHRSGDEHNGHPWFIVRHSIFSLSRIQRHSDRKLSLNANAINIQPHCMRCAPVLHLQTNNWKYSLAENEASLVSMHKVCDFMYAGMERMVDDVQVPGFKLNPPYATAPSLSSVNYSRAELVYIVLTAPVVHGSLPYAWLCARSNRGSRQFGLIYRFGSSDCEAKSHYLSSLASIQRKRRMG